MYGLQTLDILNAIGDADVGGGGRIELLWNEQPWVK